MRVHSAWNNNAVFWGTPKDEEVTFGIRVARFFIKIFCLVASLFSDAWAHYHYYPKVQVIEGKEELEAESVKKIELNQKKIEEVTAKLKLEEVDRDEQVKALQGWIREIYEAHGVDLSKASSEELQQADKMLDSAIREASKKLKKHSLFLQSLPYSKEKSVRHLAFLTSTAGPTKPLAHPAAPLGAAGSH